MPLYYKIEGDFVRGASVGRVTDDSCHDVRSAIANDPAHCAGSDELWDLNIYDSFDVTPSGIRRTIDLFRRYSRQFSGAQLAYVAPEDLAYGLVRICEALTTETCVVVRTFRSSSAAYEWLDRKPGGRSISETLEEF